MKPKFLLLVCLSLLFSLSGFLQNPITIGIDNPAAKGHSISNGSNLRSLESGLCYIYNDKYFRQQYLSIDNDTIYDCFIFSTSVSTADSPVGITTWSLLKRGSVNLILSDKEGTSYPDGVLQIFRIKKLPYHLVS